MKRSTLKDIANLTGLSISGVSRALKDHPDISPDTKEKVKEIAAALNYFPNPSAQLLRSKSSKIIAVILPEVNTFFFPELLQGISKEVEQMGYSLLFLQSDNTLQKEMDLVDYCIQMFVDGVLISVSAETAQVQHLHKLLNIGTPVLMIDRGVPNNGISFLTIDDQGTAFQAVDYLIKKGHSRILGIFDDARLHMTQLRTHGFMAAHLANQVDLDERQLATVARDEEIDSCIIALLDKFPHATAIFTMSDKLMIKTCQVLASLGLKIPEDMALISISDGKAPHYHFPAITHMRHSGEEVGSAAARLLFEMIEQKKTLLEVGKIQTSLIELGSV
jgi:LacI family transcriptional regulator